MQFQEFSLETNSTNIQGSYTQPNRIKAAVVLVHGFGEHSGRYLENVVPMLLQAKMAVVLYDNFGHGKSGGKRGHCPNYGALMALLHEVVIKAGSLFPEKPLFLYGHSMGGNLVLNFALQNGANERIKGVVATSPYLRLAFKPPRWKMILGKLMLKIWPAMTMPSGLDPNGISRIPEEVKKYINDPLVHDKVSPMFSFPIMEAGEWAISNASKLKTPSLLLHGTGDPIIDYRGTEAFHTNASTTTLKLYEGGYHELHHDSDRETMLDDVQNWLQQQL